jgi:hypothetical protein
MLCLMRIYHLDGSYIYFVQFEQNPRLAERDVQLASARAQQN